MNNNEKSPLNFNLKNARVILSFDREGFNRPFNFDFRYHSHPVNEIFFAKQGDFIIKIDEEDYLINSNSFIVVPAGVDHSVFWQGKNAKIAVMRLAFYKNNKKSDAVKSDIFGLLNKLIPQNNKPRVFRDCPGIIEKFETLAEILKNTDMPLYEEYLSHAAALFVIDFICFIDGTGLPATNANGEKNSSPPHTGGSRDDKIYNNDMLTKKTQSYAEIIDDYLSDLSYKKVTLSELAGRLNLSNRQTIRLIKQIYNATFSETISVTRMKIAKSMIENTELTLEKISEFVGYSYKGFLRAFKKATGKTPSEFRK